MGWRRWQIGRWRGKKVANILVSARHYPLSVSVFFKRAFRRLGHNVLSVGPYYEKIPWAPTKSFTKYLDKPDIVLPDVPVGDMEYVVNHPLVKDFDPEALFMFDAGYWLKYRDGHLPPINVVYIATDPHCIDASEQIKKCHTPVFMQHCYIDQYGRSGLSIQWCPYAFDPQVHYYSPGRVRKQDVTLISGLMYPNRIEALEGFKAAGLKVRHEVGLLYEEGTEVYNEGLIAFNWSSLKDLPMRFWEGLAYRNVVLTNRLPDLKALPEFQEDVHYMAFDTLDECIEKAKWIVGHEEESRKIAEAGYVRAWVGRHTYGQRALRLLRLAGVEK